MLMQPNQPPQIPQPIQLPKESRVPLIMAILMSVAFIAASGFGIWAFIGKQENQSELDKKIDAASAVAVQKAESSKEAEFAEREKDPFKSYTGSATFGSLTFSYPKSWSIYLVEKSSGIILDYYGHPSIIAGLDKENSFAFRAQILASSYDSEASKMQKLAESGKVSITVFTPINVPSVTGIRVSGEITSGKQGVMVLLPQRDKTFKLWTESTDYESDFNKVIDSLNFVP